MSTFARFTWKFGPCQFWLGIWNSRAESRTFSIIRFSYRFWHSLHWAFSIPKFACFMRFWTFRSWNKRRSLPRWLFISSLWSISLLGTPTSFMNNLLCFGGTRQIWTISCITSSTFLNMSLNFILISSTIIIFTKSSSLLNN
jgi:hypothetical protein